MVLAWEHSLDALDKAKQLLTEAARKDSDGDGILDKNGKALKDLDLVVTSASALNWQKDLALVVQNQLKKLEINVKICTLEERAYYEASHNGDFDLLMSYNNGKAVSLSSELNCLNLRMIAGYKTNFYENQNGTLAVFAETARTTANKDERDKSMCQICNILYEEAGLIPLVYEMQYAMVNSKVKGFNCGPSKT